MSNAIKLLETYTEQDIGTVIQTNIFCVDRTCFPRQSHICTDKTCRTASMYFVCLRLPPGRHSEKLKKVLCVQLIVNCV